MRRMVVASPPADWSPQEAHSLTVDLATALKRRGTRVLTVPHGVHLSTLDVPETRRRIRMVHVQRGHR